MARTTRTQPKLSSLARTNAYANGVLSGEIVAGPHVRNACRRHIDDLKHGADRGLTFDVEAADRVFGFFENVLKLSEGQFDGLPFELQPAQAFIVGSLFGWKRADGTRRFRRAYIEQGKGNGKALALDTPIPTPTGWTTMGAIKAGDLVFDDTGKPCQVIQAHPVSTDRECYRVEFDDGESIIASAEHLWLTEKRCAGTKGEARATKGVPKSRWGQWRTGIRTTAEIAQTLRYANGQYQSANHSIPLCGPLDAPDSDLPVPPYVLGAWLGDGDSDCARMTCAFADSQIVREIERERQPVRQQARHSETTGRFALSGGRGLRDGLTERLRGLGLLGNKHIPEQYLRASFAQRVALLQGLMDTDGTVNQCGGCEFSVCSKPLIDGFRELLMTLGVKARVCEGSATLNGRAVGTRYRVQFHAPQLPVFRLQRKADRNKLGHKRRRLSADRRITSCERVESVPVRCISVDSPSRMFLCGKGMIPTHNSPVAGGIGLYGMLGDGEAGAQVYAAAAKREQAGILFADAVKMVRASPSLLRRIEFSGGAGREYNMAHHASGSFFRPVSRDTGKSGSGPRPYFVLADEIHELPDGKILEMLERGFKFRRQPLMFMITNSGSDRNSVCWAEHEWAIKVAAGNVDAVTDPTYLGDVLDDSTFAYVCALDDGDDPLNDPSCWIKANPLLGVTITDEYLAGVVAQAKNIPSKQNGILRLHFCEWTDAESAWMSREVFEPLLAEFDIAGHHGKDIYLGLDLSQSRDITAMGAVVETGEVEVEAKDRDGKTVTLKKPTFDAWVEAWTPGDTIKAREDRDKIPYTLWRDQGFIHAPAGANISYRHVAQTMVEYDQSYKVRMVAYDRYAFRRFEDDAKALGLSLNFVEHPQGGVKRGKPTQEMIDAAKRSGTEAEGLWFPGSLKMFEDAIAEGRVRFKRNPVLVSAIMSAVVEQDKWDNKWLAKQKSINKIDAAVALVMAFGAANSMHVEKKPLVMMVLN